jgi:hypothetical protein
VATWNTIPLPLEAQREDEITIILCRALQQNRDARQMMFQIRTQVVELEPAAGEDLGRMDIVFIALVPREDIYFCLENKRLNVVKNGKARSYASEYVSYGMLRFVAGQYSRAVRHGGMVGYVLDGNVTLAINNVERNIRAQCSALRMEPPGSLVQSSVLAAEPRARQTLHMRPHDNSTFTLHHLFVSGASPIA